MCGQGFILCMLHILGLKIAGKQHLNDKQAKALCIVPCQDLYTDCKPCQVVLRSDQRLSFYVEETFLGAAALHVWRTHFMPIIMSIPI